MLIKTGVVFSTACVIAWTSVPALVVGVGASALAWGLALWWYFRSRKGDDTKANHSNKASDVVAIDALMAFLATLIALLVIALISMKPGEPAGPLVWACAVMIFVLGMTVFLVAKKDAPKSQKKPSETSHPRNGGNGTRKTDGS